jgi:hypothetical protein
MTAPNLITPPSRNTGRSPGALRATIIAGAVALMCLVLRVVLFLTGILFGDQMALVSNLVTAGAIGTAALLAARYWLSGSSEHEPGAMFTLAAAGLTFATAVVAVAQGVAPATPTTAASPSCQGVPVLGARFFAQTGPAGVNARSGPGTGYPQVDRFSGNCTLGFDGFCIGEAIPTATGTDSIDTRWLIVHQRDELVSAAKVLPQTNQAVFGTTPNLRCAALGGYPSPGPITFTPTTADNAITLTAASRGARLVGYAVRLQLPAAYGYPLSLIKVKINPPDFTATYDYASDVADLPGHTGIIQIVASVCIAPDIPTGQPSLHQASFDAGTLTSLRPTRLPDAGDTTLLAKEACSGTS